MLRRIRSNPSHVLSLWTLLLGGFSTEGQWAGSPGVGGEFLDTVRVSAVTGGDVKLPCDTNSPQPSDLLLLVVWYKDDEPVYSYDGRIKGPSANWVDKMLAGRADWHAAMPSTLQIRNIVPEDRALYRCRVDFKISPTMNQKILLDVIELPAKPKVFDELGKEIIGFAGPYVEDTTMKLTCVVSGGNPTPRLRWWRDDKVLSTLPSLDDDSRTSQLDLRIPKLTRDYHEAVYSCTADNTALVPLLRTNIQIQLHLRPLFVEILTREQPLSVQQTAEIGCRTVGARPAAIITWWLDNEKLNSAAQKNSENQNETFSMLRWTPRMKNDGQTLTCRASHAVLKHATIDTSLLLKLHYVPIVVLKLGSELNPSDIEEGDDVYFTCVVQAYPPAYKVVWEHNGQVISHNQKAGVIATSGHLAIQAASREQAGNYSCTASNVEGDGESQPFDLKIIFKPVCRMTSMEIVGVAINSQAKIICEVDAFPQPDSFQWILNNSIGAVELDTENITAVDGRSILSFTPKSETDYGTISCQASNSVGQQIEPCRFAVHRPYNCSTMNMTDDSVELQCVAGYSGGLHTSYSVEAWESGNLLMNVSTATPIWKLRGLGSGKTLNLVFYAYNAKGRTEINTLRVHTLSRLALHTEAKSTNIVLDLNWATKFLAALSGVILLVIVAWKLTLTILMRNLNDRPSQYAAPVQIMKVYSSNGNHSPLQPDDKNPDVVPLEKGLNYKEDTERFPEPPLYGVTSPLVESSKSIISLQREMRSKAHTPNTLASDAQSIGTLGDDDRRSLTSGTLSRRREIVTTRTPLLENARESYV